MKYFLLIIFITLTSIMLLINKCIGQTVKWNTDYYSNGQVHWRGLDTCYFKHKTMHCYPIGFWEYFYSNGAKQLESHNDTNGVKYINMWLPDGKIILANGTGLLYRIQYGAHIDSLIYTLRDNIKTGIFQRYRQHKNGVYFLVESGEYENNKKTGTWTFRDSTIDLHYVSYFKDSNTSVTRYFYSNGMLKEEGIEIDKKKNGAWKFYNENGILVKECGFKTDKEFGSVIEYYSNRQIKSTGQYTQVKGFYYGKVAYDPNDPTKTRKKKMPSDNIVAMDGEWKFYTENGQLIETIVYNKKILSDN